MNDEEKKTFATAAALLPLVIVFHLTMWVRSAATSSKSTSAQLNAQAPPKKAVEPTTDSEICGMAPKPNAENCLPPPTRKE